MENTRNVLTATSRKVLIAKKEYNQGKANVFLELRNDDEIWVIGRYLKQYWMKGPEIQLRDLPQKVVQKLIKSSDYGSFSFRKALAFAWHEAAKQNAFFEGADIFLQNHPIARKAYNNGRKTAFLEVRHGSEFWVYGKVYEPRVVIGPEIKIELDLIPKVKEELLFRESWDIPFYSADAKKAVHQAWLEATKRNPFFEGLVAEN